MRSLLAIVCLLPGIVLAAPPSWWTTRGVVATNAVQTNDYAAVNAGQVKWIASNACAELDVTLPGGAGTGLQAVVSGFSSTGNYVAVNVGQVKWLANGFYDRLIAVDYTNAYPWTSATTDDVSYAVVNIGQVKYLFSFDPGRDTNGDFMPDWWTSRLGTDYSGLPWFSDTDGDGLSLLEEYTRGTCPTNADSDGDGLADGLEVQWGSDPVNSTSLLVTISGTVTNSTAMTGTVQVVLAETAGGWNSRWQTNLTNVATSSSFSLAHVPTGKALYLRAYCDQNASGRWDPIEPFCDYTNNSIQATGNVSGATLLLAFPVDLDQDGLPDAWEAQYGLSTNHTVTTNGLVGWWKMDETNGPTVFDSSGQGNHGTAQGMNPWPSVSGYPSGGALNLNPTSWVDWVDVPNSVSLSISNKMTVAAWIRPVKGVWTLVEKSKIEDPDYSLGDYLGEGTLYWWVGADGWVECNYPTGEWFSVVATVDGTNLALFINGQAVSSATWSGQTVSSTNLFHIGQGYSGAFSGTIGDVRMWNTVISASAISNMVVAIADPDGDGVINLIEAAYGTCPTNSDTDGDGILDGEEIRLGTDPAWALSKPVTLSGTITEEGTNQTGTLWVLAALSEDEWTSAYATNIPASGYYTLENVLTLRAYWLRAFRDVDADGMLDFGERYSVYRLTPLSLMGPMSGLDLVLRDGDADQDGLPDLWELLCFGNGDQHGCGDFDNDGLSNVEEYRIESDPYKHAWVDNAGGGSVTIRWNPPKTNTIAHINYQVFTNSVQLLSGDCAASVSNVTVTPLMGGILYHMEITGTNSAGISVWSNTVSWTEPGGDLMCWNLLGAFSTQYVGRTSAVVATRTISSSVIDGYDHFYISANPNGAGGWTQPGCRIEMSMNDDPNRVLCGYGAVVSSNSSLDVTECDGQDLAGGPQQQLRFDLRYDGGGYLASTNRLYLLRWRPSVSVGGGQ